MNWTYRLLLFLLPVGLISCEREIEIDLGKNDPTIVVEGIIEAGASPRVLITKNRGFFDDFPSDVAALLDTFIIQDAQVTISDGVTTYPLTFQPSFEYPYFYYTNATLIGEVGKTYFLEVEALGQKATAQTRIPPPVAVDNMYYGLNVFDENEDSLGFAYITYTDPDTFGNAYRLYSRRNTEPEFFPVTGQLASDEFINGRTVTFFTGQSDKPFAAQDTFIENEFFYTLGDTIYIKFCSIGMREFDFYNTFEAASSSNGNPFASPIVIKTNIQGGQGVWCGISYFSDTLIATQ